MKPRVYIETSIPSFYHETRTEPEMVAQRIWTRQWWDGRRDEYEVVTSDAVLDELSGGEYPTRAQALSLVGSLPVLLVESAIAEIVEAYIVATKIFCRCLPTTYRGETAAFCGFCERFLTAYRCTKEHIPL